MTPKAFFRIAGALAVWIVALGCATTGRQPMYYWEGYSESLYQAKKHPSADTLAEHKSVLERIIETSKEKNCRIPPGVYAELGYIYALQNDNKKAIELFTLEKQTYPEASLFMDRLIQRSERIPEAENPKDAENQPDADQHREATVEKVGMEVKTK